MASEKILENKKAVVAEIQDLVKNSESVLVFTYQGLTVADLSELRIKLHECDSDVKVYKNTLVKRALADLKIELESSLLEGPNAFVFGKDLLEPIKILSEYVKGHEKAVIKVGIISGAPADLDTINEYASIPSREGLLTMFASGMIQYVKEFAIGLNMYAEQLEK